MIGNSFLMPSFLETLDALLNLMFTSAFYKVIALSALRVLAGLTIGCAAGIILSIICSYSKPIYEIFSPIVTVIRSTPVASFIVVMWILLKSDMLAIFIAFIMVMPIIWQSTTDAISSIDRELLEVCKIFEFSKRKTLKLLILPTIKKYLFPAIITSSGLAWKAEIAAEIIAYTRNSIGQGINDAKYEMETPTVFAWTAVIIFLSILFEYATKLLLRRHKDES